MSYLLHPASFIITFICVYSFIAVNEPTLLFVQGLNKPWDLTTIFSLKKSIGRSKSSSYYTPLVLFSFPRGHNAVADEMEDIVSKYEKEMGVTVDRFDILRDRNAKLLYDLLQESYIEPLASRPSSFLSRISTNPSGDDVDASSSTQGHPYNTVYAKKKRVVGPLLYHRNSRQFIQDIHIARNALKMRSWIKGRLLFLIEDGNDETSIVGKEEGEYNQFTDGQQNDDDDEGSSSWMDEGLTELQQRGKEQMIRRMKDGKK